MPYKDATKQKESQRRSYERNREVYAARNRVARAKKFAVIQELKKEPCTDCKQTYHPAVMQFDHVRGKKIDSITNLIRLAAWQDVLDEIAKCELVCANCHAMRTYTRLVESGQVGYYDPA